MVDDFYIAHYRNNSKTVNSQHWRAHIFLRIEAINAVIEIVVNDGVVVKVDTKFALHVDKKELGFKVDTNHWV
jgi:hypothetical protein